MTYVQKESQTNQPPLQKTGSSQQLFRPCIDLAIEKKKNCKSISTLILALFLMTSRHFSFSFPEDMDGLTDFLYMYVAYF